MLISLRQVQFYGYDALVGVYNSGGNHWNLLVD